jgi:hypothetical protein
MDIHQAALAEQVDTQAQVVTEASLLVRDWVAPDRPAQLV